MSNDLVPVVKPRDTGLAYVLWLASFVGLSGLHRFYLGRWVSGLIWLFTGGLCLVGTVVDAFMLPRMVDDVNKGASGW